MKLYFKEDKRARGQTELWVVLADINPLMEPFVAYTTAKPSDGELGLSISANGMNDYWTGGGTTSERLIFHNTLSQEDLEKTKEAFKKKLKPILQKYGYFNGLSEERIK